MKFFAKVRALRRSWPLSFRPINSRGRLFALAAALCFSTSQILWAEDASVQIDVSKPGPRLNPRMYGIFLEEINFGVDGGLYAELIRNRGFEDAKPPEGFIL